MSPGRFAFRTPFTEAGKAHGSLENQFMRRTILTTQHHFPYVKTRVLVVAQEEEVLSPLECAIANMQDKSKSLRQALHQVPIDMKFLQMQLQGGIATSVNQVGGMSSASVQCVGLSKLERPEWLGKVSLTCQTFRTHLSSTLAAV